MDYLKLIETVRSHLEAHDVQCEVDIAAPAAEKTVTRVESMMNVSLPSELRRFYLTAGDGLSFRWQADPEDLNQPFANLQIPPLSDLTSGLARGELYSPEEAEEYGFPATDDPELAKRTAARMWHWLPIIAEGNGDLICLDLSVTSGPVIFHQHDWLDGGSGDDGHLLANNWNEFLRAWGSVCFQFPTSLWWPSTFQPGSGVDWDGEFRAPFRIASLAGQAQ